jgi:hypothetical protein
MFPEVSKNLFHPKHRVPFATDPMSLLLLLLLLLLLTEIDLSLGGSTDKTSIDHYINILLANDAHSVHHGACKLHLAWHQKYNYKHFFSFLIHNIHLKSRAAEI